MSRCEIGTLGWALCLARNYEFCDCFNGEIDGSDAMRTNPVDVKDLAATLGCAVTREDTEVSAPSSATEGK